MQGKIALEEHFAIPETAEDSMGYFPQAVESEVRARNADIHGRRLALMDEHGIEMMILSLNAPAVQAIPDTARRAARPSPRTAGIAAGRNRPAYRDR